MSLSNKLQAYPEAMAMQVDRLNANLSIQLYPFALFSSQAGATAVQKYLCRCALSRRSLTGHKITDLLCKLFRLVHIFGEGSMTSQQTSVVELNAPDHLCESAGPQGACNKLAAPVVSSHWISIGQRHVFRTLSGCIRKALNEQGWHRDPDDSSQLKRLEVKAQALPLKELRGLSDPTRFRGAKVDHAIHGRPLA